MGIVARGKETLYDSNDSPLASLSLDRCSLPADASGNVLSYAGAVSTLSILLSGVDDSANWSVTCAATGLSGSLAGKTYTVSSMSADSGYVDFTAKKAGYADLVKRFHVGKVRQGNLGNPGLSVWHSYHSSPPGSAPASPTGDGTTSGWSASITESSIWISMKQSVNRSDSGTWSIPAIISAISLAPIYAPKYLGAGKLLSINEGVFRRDTIAADGTVTLGINIAPHSGDWMYNYDISSVTTLSVFRWSGYAWETSTVTFEHWASANEDVLRYIKGGVDAATRSSRTPALWTFFDSLISNEGFFDRLAARIIRSANYIAGMAGMSIDLNNAAMQAENKAWQLLGNGHAVFRDIEIYGLDYEEIDCSDYIATAPDYPFGSGEELDNGDFIAGSWSPDRMLDCGLFMGGF